MRVLLLGGTSEASQLAGLLADDPRFTALLSLAGVTSAPLLPRIAWRKGGFGGADGLAAWLRAERIAALVDATHPYATRMTHQAVQAAADAGVAYLRIARPAWQPGPGDRWTLVPDAATAAAVIGEVTGTVLLTIGTRALATFGGGPPRRTIVRCIDPPDPALLPRHAELLLARGPFTLEGELELLSRCEVACLVSKNSGGAATAAKLQAARLLSIPVVLIERPAAAQAGAPALPDALPDALPETVPDADQAFAWLLGLPQPPAQP